MVEAFKRIAKKIEKLDGNSSSLTEIQFFNSVNNIKSEIAQLVKSHQKGDRISFTAKVKEVKHEKRKNSLSIPYDLSLIHI